MLKRITITTGAVATALCLFASAASAQVYLPCSAKRWPGLTFAPGVPSYAVGEMKGQCYCGVWTGVTPEQARKTGWYSSCHKAMGTCHFDPRSDNGNAVCPLRDDAEKPQR
jgi:hypothetical protein